MADAATPVKGKDAKRLEALTSAKDAGLLDFVDCTGKRFHARMAGAQQVFVFTGPQVDAFLLGIRIGQVLHDKPFARTT